MNSKERQELTFILTAVLFIVMCVPSFWAHREVEKYEAAPSAVNTVIEQVEETVHDHPIVVIIVPRTETAVNAETGEEDTFETYEVVESYHGEVLNAYNGRVPTVNGLGSETYYNLDMSYVVEIMRSIGFDAESYPYWEREDGCKMLGDYIMVAANLDIYPRGSVVETTLGPGLVCDTGGFVEWNPYGLDIATTW